MENRGKRFLITGKEWEEKRNHRQYSAKRVLNLIAKEPFISGIYFTFGLPLKRRIMAGEHWSREKTGRDRQSAVAAIGKTTDEKSGI